LVQARAPRTDVTVSGLSSGGSMATQMHIAFSKDISGCGILAGPPYYCAGNYMAATMCMSGSVTSISVPGILNKIKSYESWGNIDNTTNLKNDPVYIFSGKYDTVSSPGIVKLNGQIYTSLNAKVKTNYDMGSAHGFPTENYGLSCMVLNMYSYINNCGFNMAYDVLNYLYGGTLIRPSSDDQTPLPGQFVTFDQQAFMSPPSGLDSERTPSASVLKWLSQSMRLHNGKSWYWPTSGLANWVIPSVKTSMTSGATSTRSFLSSFDREGFVYFPSACAQGQNCSIHVALHGCQQGKFYVGDIFATKAGYLEVAELNNIIVLFPQVVPSVTLPINPMGCWDWWGYSSLSFATKSAPQMSGVKKMIDTVRLVNKAMIASV